MNKLIYAIDGIYSSNPSQDDKDLAFLILQFGGPGLLDIMHRAIGFPNILDDQRNNTNVNINQCQTRRFLKNININPDLPAYRNKVKMDETYVDVKTRWCPLDNKGYGFCYLHSRDLNLEFNSYEDICSLCDKECMVMAVSSNSTKKNAHPVLIWPTCSKSESDSQLQLIQELSDSFYLKNGTLQRIFDSQCYMSCKNHLLFIP